MKKNKYPNIERYRTPKEAHFKNMVLYLFRYNPERNRNNTLVRPNKALTLTGSSELDAMSLDGETIIMFKNKLNGMAQKTISISLRFLK